MEGGGGCSWNGALGGEDKGASKGFETEAAFPQRVKTGLRIDAALEAKTTPPPNAGEALSLHPPADFFLSPSAVLPSADVALNSRSFAVAIPDSLSERPFVSGQSANAFFSSARGGPPPYSSVLAENPCAANLDPSSLDENTQGDDVSFSSLFDRKGREASVEGSGRASFEALAERLRESLSPKTAAFAESVLLRIQEAFSDVFETQLLPGPSSFAGRAALRLWTFGRNKTALLRRAAQPGRAFKKLAFWISSLAGRASWTLRLNDASQNEFSAPRTHGGFALSIHRTEGGGQGGCSQRVVQGIRGEELLLAEGCTNDRSVAIDGGGCVLVSSLQLGRGEQALAGEAARGGSELLGCATPERVLRNSGRVGNLTELFDFLPSASEATRREEEDSSLPSPPIAAPAPSLSLIKRLRLEGRRVACAVFLRPRRRPFQASLLLGFSDGSLQLLRRTLPRGAPASGRFSGSGVFGTTGEARRGRPSWRVSWSDFLGEKVEGFCVAPEATGIPAAAEGPVVFTWTSTQAFLFAPLDERCLFYPPSKCKVYTGAAAGSFRLKAGGGAVAAACFTARSELAVLSRDGALDFFKVRLSRQEALTLGGGGAAFELAKTGGVSFQGLLKEALQRGDSTRLYHSRLLDALVVAVESSPSLFVLRCTPLSSAELHRRAKEAPLLPFWCSRFFKGVAESLGLRRETRPRGRGQVTSETLSVLCVEWRLPWIEQSRQRGSSQEAAPLQKKSFHQEQSAASDASLGGVGDFAFAEDCGSGTWVCAAISSTCDEAFLFGESLHAGTAAWLGGRSALDGGRHPTTNVANSLLLGENAGIPRSGGGSWEAGSSQKRTGVSGEAEDLLLQHSPSLRHCLQPPIKGARPLGVSFLNSADCEGDAFCTSLVLAVRWGLSCPSLLTAEAPSEQLPVVVSVYRVPANNAASSWLFPLWWKNCSLSGDRVGSGFCGSFFPAPAVTRVLDEMKTSSRSVLGSPDAFPFQRLPLSLSSLGGEGGGDFLNNSRLLLTPPFAAGRMQQQSGLPLDEVPGELRRRLEETGQRSLLPQPRALGIPEGSASLAKTESSAPPKGSRLPPDSQLIGGGGFSASFEAPGVAAGSSSLRWRRGRVGDGAGEEVREKRGFLQRRFQQLPGEALPGGEVFLERSARVEAALRDRLSRLRRIQLHDFQERLLHSQRQQEIARALGGGPAFSAAYPISLLQNSEAFGDGRSNSSVRLGGDETFPLFSRHSRGFQGALARHSRRALGKASFFGSSASHPYGRRMGESGSVGSRFAFRDGGASSSSLFLPAPMRVEGGLAGSDVFWEGLSRTDGCPDSRWRPRAS